MEEVFGVMRIIDEHEIIPRGSKLGIGSIRKAILQTCWH